MTTNEAPSASAAGATTAADRPDPILELRGIDAGYGEGLVLRDVTIAVRRGAITALIGPNGAGKSTLLRVASGLRAPMHGSVLLAGTDVTKRPAEWRSRRGMCFIPEGRAVYRSLTVRDNILMQTRDRRRTDALERAADAFAVLGHRMDQIAGTLSGGEQQMLALAAAHLRAPDVLIVDEASLGLAPVIVDEVFAFLLRVQSEGRSLLLVDQFVDRVLSVATDAYVMRRGAVVHEGPAHELLAAGSVEHYFGTASD
jgi:branched-chain amino acid transport system ATP-binding protein